MAILIAYFLTHYRYWFYLTALDAFSYWIIHLALIKGTHAFKPPINEEWFHEIMINSCSKQGLICPVSLPVDFLGASRTNVVRMYTFTITVSAQNVLCDWVYLKR